jgi:hypothetical protein
LEAEEEELQEDIQRIRLALAEEDEGGGESDEDTDEEKLVVEGNGLLLLCLMYCRPGNICCSKISLF